MPILRINQQPGGAPNRFRIDVSAADVPNFQPPSFKRQIEFIMSPQDGERIRWYLEDYLQFDEDPAPEIAHRVEQLMAERGEALFRSIFEGLNEGVQLWALIEPHLSSTRIEITTGIAEATAIPWELIRNPHTRTNLAVSAEAFVRTQQAAQLALAPRAEVEKVRILLVICRPKGEEDVPFRSVAGRLVTRLSEGDRNAFQLDVLRPPTYEQLATTLGLAKENGRPYHIVHFDGHGVYADPKNLDGVGKILSSLTLTGEATGARGYLAFEDPDSATRTKFVDGFNAGYRAREGEHAAVRGYPIFLGLGVGMVGVAFHFHTVNVKYEADEAFLDFLDGDAFKSGLKLATTTQPAIAPLAGMALALTKNLAKRNRNVSVQDCYLGLDFAGTSMGARLAAGDYIAVQIPENLQRVWYWDDWAYEPRTGLIVSRADPAALIPYNYVVFGVSRFEGD